MDVRYEEKQHTAVPVHTVRVAQLVCLRDMLRRGAHFNNLYFNEVTREIQYMRNGTEFFITPNGDVYKMEEVPVTTYKWERVFVSDRHEERDLAEKGVPLR